MLNFVSVCVCLCNCKETHYPKYQGYNQFPTLYKVCHIYTAMTANC